MVNFALISFIGVATLFWNHAGSVPNRQTQESFLHGSWWCCPKSKDEPAERTEVQVGYNNCHRRTKKTATLTLQHWMQSFCASQNWSFDWLMCATWLRLNQWPCSWLGIYVLTRSWQENTVLVQILARSWQDNTCLNLGKVLPRFRWDLSEQDLAKIRRDLAMI